MSVSHTQSPGLAITRSYRPAEYWVSAVMAMMDAAAIAHDVVDGAAPSAPIFLAAARESLGHIAVATRGQPAIPPPPSREAFALTCAALESAGVPLRVDREAAWLAFRATQDRYADLVVGLAERVRLRPAAWRLAAREDTVGAHRGAPPAGS